MSEKYFSTYLWSGKDIRLNQDREFDRMLLTDAPSSNFSMLPQIQNRVVKKIASLKTYNANYWEWNTVMNLARHSMLTAKSMFTGRRGVSVSLSRWPLLSRQCTSLFILRAVLDNNGRDDSTHPEVEKGADKRGKRDSLRASIVQAKPSVHSIADALKGIRCIAS